MCWIFFEWIIAFSFKRLKNNWWIIPQIWVIDLFKIIMHSVQSLHGITIYIAKILPIIELNQPKYSRSWLLYLSAQYWATSTKTAYGCYGSKMIGFLDFSVFIQSFCILMQVGYLWFVEMSKMVVGELSPPLRRISWWSLS